MVNIFRFNHVIKSFPDFQLGPLDLELAPGMALGYIGPNGSGKTTTMHCLAGLLRPDKGHVEIFGQPVDLENVEWKKNIGYVGNINSFYEGWTAEQHLNVRSQFYPTWSDSYMRTLIDRFDLKLKTKVKNLSTGNRVKLALISVLAYSPKLLILDEPTSGLDPVVRSEVLDTLFEILEDGEHAIFYATHILSDINRLVDEVAFLWRGKLIVKKTKDDLMNQWRKISFQFSGNEIECGGVVDHQQEEDAHQLISCDYETTIYDLRKIGVQHIQENRMTLEEIAVYIIKKGIQI